MPGARGSAAASLGTRLARVADRLADVYGRPRRRLADPLDCLIETILSQNTSDVNSSRAFGELKRAFPRWSAAAAAPRSAIERAIRPGGLARLKSRRIQDVLRRLGVRARRSGLEGLRRMPAPQAAQRLTGLPGVGPKTRACVLLFAGGHPAFPVDTHVHRVVRRLGLACEGWDAARTQQALEPWVPPGRALDLHLNLIRLGRELCRPRGPRCCACPLRDGCAYALAAA
jgi:endonuclease-3